MGLLYIKNTWVVYFLSFFLTFLLPHVGFAAGLGDAGTLTWEGLWTGLFIIGIVLLIFLGLLIRSRIIELKEIRHTIEEVHPKKDYVFSKEDIMLFSEPEIEDLIELNQHDKV